MALLTLPWRALRYRRAQGLLQNRVAETLPLVRSATPARTASTSASTSGGLGGRTIVSLVGWTLCGLRWKLGKEKKRERERETRTPKLRCFSFRRLSKALEGGGTKSEKRGRTKARERERRKQKQKLSSLLSHERAALFRPGVTFPPLVPHPLLACFLLLNQGARGVFFFELLKNKKKVPPSNSLSLVLFLFFSLSSAAALGPPLPPFSDDLSYCFFCL